MTILTSAPGAPTTRRWSHRAATSAGIRFIFRRPERRSARRAAAVRSRTVPTPTRRNSLRASSSSSCRRSTPRSNGRGAARPPRSCGRGPSRRDRVQAAHREVSSRSHEDAHRAIESVARESYGRLVAFLCARTRDVAGAEDALGEALVAALATWPREGTPKNPEGWLLTAARRRLIDRLRHERVQAENAPTLKLVIAATGVTTTKSPHSVRSSRTSD